MFVLENGRGGLTAHIVRLNFVGNSEMLIIKFHLLDLLLVRVQGAAGVPLRKECAFIIISEQFLHL